MQLKNTFVIPVPVDEAWRVLLDVEQIAPCMPGASVDSVDGDNIVGRVKIKLGPIGVGYKGTIRFVERDEARHRAVLSAAAGEARGGGTAQATIAASLVGVGQETTVTVVTELAITGKPAQFGRGVMADVSKHIMNQFAVNLARELQSGNIVAGAVNVPSPTGSTIAGSVSPAPVPATAAKLSVVGSEPSASTSAESSINALGLLMGPARRLAPLTVGIAIGWFLCRGVTYRGRRRES